MEDLSGYGYSKSRAPLNDFVKDNYVPEYETNKWANNRRNQDIPEEYRDDPELYFAI
jgi:hypothetical protein